jgi:hypothetical protein
MRKNIPEEELSLLRKELDEIYTPLSEAKEEIWKRWNNKELKKEVSKFLNNDIPEFLKDKPKAYLARQVATPNFEFFQFLKLAVHSNLEIVCPGFIEDKFSSNNPNKYYLGKMLFHNGTGKNGGQKINNMKIINFNESEGKKIKDVKTLWGEGLAEFHYRILNALVPDIKDKVFDISSWLKRRGSSADKFYENFLALFICNGVLFENFLLDKEEGYFTKKIILKTFKKLRDKFKIKPLVVNLLSVKNESDLCWFYYPGFLEPVIKNYRKIKIN